MRWRRPRCTPVHEPRWRDASRARGRKGAGFAWRTRRRGQWSNDYKFLPWPMQQRPFGRASFALAMIRGLQNPFRLNSPFLPSSRLPECVHEEGIRILCGNAIFQALQSQNPAPAPERAEGRPKGANMDIICKTRTMICFTGLAMFLVSIKILLQLEMAFFAVF